MLTWIPMYVIHVYMVAIFKMNSTVSTVQVSHDDHFILCVIRMMYWLVKYLILLANILLVNVIATVCNKLRYQRYALLTLASPNRAPRISEMPVMVFYHHDCSCRQLDFPINVDSLISHHGMKLFNWIKPFMEIQLWCHQKSSKGHNLLIIEL